MKIVKLEIKDDRAKELERVMKESGLESWTEYLNNEITILERVNKALKEGKSLAIVDEMNGSYVVLKMSWMKNTHPELDG